MLCCATPTTAKRVPWTAYLARELATVAPIPLFSIPEDI